MSGNPGVAGCIPELGGLTALSGDLDLSGCSLGCGLPTSLSALTGLTGLDLSNNDLQACRAPATPTPS